MPVRFVSKKRALSVVESKVKPVEVALDLGPGICPQPFIKPRVHICVEAHRPYIEHVKRNLANDPRYVFINATWDKAIAMLPDKSVDTVFALDFIEHLEKEDGRRMLREAERVARRQVVIHTPKGFYQQSYDDPNKPDRWGMDGGYWQTHRSGWDFDDFDDRWDIVCCKDYLDTDEDNQPVEEPMPAMWAFLDLRETTKGSVKKRSAFEVTRSILEQTLPPIAFRGLTSTWRVFLYASRKSPLRH